MPATISSLPTELQCMIHQHLMDGASAGPAAESTPSVQQHAPLMREQATRRAAAARANFASVNKRFHQIDKVNVSLGKNGDVGCLVTGNAIRNLTSDPNLNFETSLRSLFERNAHIDVDFSALSPAQTTTLLRVLRERAQDQSGPLHNVRFNVDLDDPRLSPDLIRDIDSTMTEIRNSPNGKNAAFELACSSHDASRTSPPDLLPWSNLTSIDLSECRYLTVAPDFSKNLELREVNLSGCISLSVTPDFSANGKLASINLSWCGGLTAAPDLSANPELTSVNLFWCSGLTAAPDFSANPMLTAVYLYGCSGLSDREIEALQQLLGDRLRT